MARKSSNKGKKGAKKKASGRKVTNRQAVPRDTFDAWISKQTELYARKGGPSQKSSENKTMPRDTFNEWIKAQPVKEARRVEGSTVLVDTFEEWINRQVASSGREPKEPTEEKDIEEIYGPTTRGELTKDAEKSKELVVRPTSTIANKDIVPLFSTNDEIEITFTTRNSKRSVSTPVWFVHEDHKLLLLPLEGSKTQWFKNVQVNPELEISIGKVRKRVEVVPKVSEEKARPVVEKFRSKYGADEVEKFYSNFDSIVEISL